MHHVVDGACAELRSLASERKQDWKRALRWKQSQDVEHESEQTDLVIREEWRAWRERICLSEIDHLPDGNRVILHALLCDTLSSYEEMPHFVALPRESDSLTARLNQLAAAAHAEILKVIGNERRSQARYLPYLPYLPLLLQNKLRELCLELPDKEQDWDVWYADAERRFAGDATCKERILKMRERSAAVVIQKSFAWAVQRRHSRWQAQREHAAATIQRALRLVTFPRVRYLRRMLEETRKACLLTRLHRRLKRHIVRWRSRRGYADSHGSHDTPQGQRAAIRIQAFCRSRWSRGWVYCWAPPFHRPSTLSGRSNSPFPTLTVAMARAFADLRQRKRLKQRDETLRRGWAPALQAEFHLLHSWCSELAERRHRQEFEARSVNRFEVQWKRYADGLEQYARSQVSERKQRDHWVATVSDGKAVWLNERTGQIRSNDPVESRVRGTLARERKKAEGRLEEHIGVLRTAWMQEDEAAASLTAAGYEELQMICRCSAAAAPAKLSSVG